MGLNLLSIHYRFIIKRCSSLKGSCHQKANSFSSFITTISHRWFFVSIGWKQNEWRDVVSDFLFRIPLKFWIKLMHIETDSFNLKRWHQQIVDLFQFLKMITQLTQTIYIFFKLKKMKWKFKMNLFWTFLFYLHIDSSKAISGQILQNVKNSRKLKLS